MSEHRVHTRWQSAALVGLVAMVVGVDRGAAVTVECNGVVKENPPQAGAHLGWAIDVGVASDGSEWLVGGAPAPLSDALGRDTDTGAIALYKNAKPGDKPIADFNPPADLQPGDLYGHSVSLDGDWLAVGAPLGNGRVRDSGVVYIFRFEGNIWRQKHRVEATGGATNDRFGFSVALSGSRLVVGAPYDSDRGTRAGAAYVFEFSESNWDQKAKIFAKDSRPFDLFGSSVAIRDDTIVSGAPFADDLKELSNFGAAYVFRRELPEVWPQTAKLTADVNFRVGNIQFGASVALSKDRIVVGAPGNDSPLDSGRVFVFGRDGTALRELSPESPGRGEQFGVSVDLDEDQIVVGARFDGEGGAKAGAAYLFKNDRSKPEKKFIHSQDGAAFGQSVAIRNGRVFLGGFQYDADSTPESTPNDRVILDAGAVAMCSSGPLEVDLFASKTDGVTIVEPGQSLTYTIKFTNQGSVDVAGAKITDTVPPELDLPSGLPASLDLRVGETKTFLLPATVDPEASGKFTNEVCIFPPLSVREQNPTDNCATDTNRIREEPPVDLHLEIAASPDPVAMEETLTYTITVTNEGSATATGVEVDARAPGGGLVPKAGDCADFTCKLGSIPPGRSKAIPLPFDVPACYAGEDPIPFEASVRGNESDIDPDDNSDEVFVDVKEGVANLAILKFEDIPDPVAPGGTITYRLEVKNLGPNPACNVRLRQRVEDGSFIGPGSPTCAPVGASEVECFLAEKLDKDGTASLDMTFQVPDPCPAEIRSEAEVSSETPDPDGANNRATAETRCGIIDLAIDKVDEQDPVAPGDELTYTITVKNVGSADAAGVTVSDVPPEQLTELVWCSGESCSPDTPGPVATQVDLPPNTPEVFRMRGLVLACGPLKNQVFAKHPKDSAKDEEETQVTGLALLCQHIDGTGAAGSMVTYTFVLINCGPADQMDNPGDEFTNTLPPGLTLVSASAESPPPVPSGTVATFGNTVTWNGAAAVGQTVTITIEATVDAGTEGMTLCNQATGLFDLDENGTNETMRLSDDPHVPGGPDPCCFTVPDSLLDIPTLSDLAALALALLLAALSLGRLRRPSAGR